MSAIAKVLLQKGKTISGSDLKESRETKMLNALGAKIFIGHDEKNLDFADYVVISSAIPKNNPEIKKARRENIPILQRAEMLARLISGKKGIAVAGTHGKTTTTSMISQLMVEHGLNPTYLIGGELNDIGTNAESGSGKILVAEADESDGSFLFLKPWMTVVTNIEEDHFDYYNSLEEIKENFLAFINSIPSDGLAILCGDCSRIKSILPKVKAKFCTYGLKEDNDFYAKNINLGINESSFDFYKDGKKIGSVKISLPGLHNILNSMATLAVSNYLGLEFEKSTKILEKFSGAKRRFQFIGESQGITIIDDYAHHPSEVKATLEAARSGRWKRIISVFQPHRYTRTMFLYNQFADSFNQADKTILTDIYSAGELPIPGISGKLIADTILEKNPSQDLAYFPVEHLISHYLLNILEKDDLLITMGAGDIWTVGEDVLKLLNSEK